MKKGDSYFLTFVISLAVSIMIGYFDQIVLIIKSSTFSWIAASAIFAGVIMALVTIDNLK